MMTIGDGIAILSICSVVLATIIKFVPATKKNGNTNGYVTREVCQLKSADIQRRLKSIEDKIDQIISNGHKSR